MHLIWLHSYVYHNPRIAPLTKKTLMNWLIRVLARRKDLCWILRSPVGWVFPDFSILLNLNTSIPSSLFIIVIRQPQISSLNWEIQVTLLVFLSIYSVTTLLCHWLSHMILTNSFDHATKNLIWEGIFSFINSVPSKYDEWLKIAMKCRTCRFKSWSSPFIQNSEC